MSKRTRYALVGTGGRAMMFLEPLAQQYREHGELVGLCDINLGRLAFYKNRLVQEWGYHEVPTFEAAAFDQMIKQTQPDCVIVTTIDAFHHQYVIRAMELGCDAITEKPMTIDAEKCCAIFDAVERTDRKLRVTFNYRWKPGATKVRQLLQDGVIGDVIHVDMEYLLNTRHGADYFRRWHRDKAKSGGLMVHKATHHFDLVNWWIDAVPDTIFGMGRLAFYGKANAQRRGIEVKYDRYTGHDTAGDPFAIDLTSSDRLRNLYFDQEKYDGYQRDRNVFGDNITIEDSMSVMVKYRTGAVLNYSLNAYLPREGFHVVFNGTKGRMEFSENHGSHIITGQTAQEMAIELGTEDYTLTIQPMFGDVAQVPVPRAEGGHGGGDVSLQSQIFSPDPPQEPFGRNAGHGQGAASILVGSAANISFETGQPVQIKELCPYLDGATRLNELT